jgi:hypothetical protein
MAAEELARQVAQLTSMSNVVFDCAQDGFEGLQLFERNEYHAIIVAKTIGRSYPQMKGIEFLKIAAACCEEDKVPTCPGIVVVGAESESSFLFKLEENERDLVTACICKKVLQVSDFAHTLQDLFTNLQAGGHQPPKRAKMTQETEVSASSCVNTTCCCALHSAMTLSLACRFLVRTGALQFKWT